MKDPINYWRWHIFNISFFNRIIRFRIAVHFTLNVRERPSVYFCLAHVDDFSSRFPFSPLIIDNKRGRRMHLGADTISQSPWCLTGSVWHTHTLPKHPFDELHAANKCSYMSMFNPENAFFCSFCLSWKKL